jgi:hypothetical protein
VPPDPAARSTAKPTPEELRTYAAELAEVTRRVRAAESERDRRICEATARGMAFRDVAVITGVPFRRIVDLFEAEKRRTAAKRRTAEQRKEAESRQTAEDPPAPEPPRPPASRGPVRRPQRHGSS